MHFNNVSLIYSSECKKKYITLLILFLQSSISIGLSQVIEELKLLWIQPKTLLNMSEVERFTNYLLVYKSIIQ